MRGRTPNPNFLTNEQIDAEIARLTTSEAVKLAQKEQRLKNARKQYMYQLQSMERRGLWLIEHGISQETIAEYLFTHWAADENESSVEDNEYERT